MADITNKILLSSSGNVTYSLDEMLGGKTLDPVYKSSNAVLSNGNKTASTPSNASTVVGIQSISKGKRYWEVKLDYCYTNFIGVTKDNESLSAITWSTGMARNFYASGTKYATTGVAYSTALKLGDIISVLLDMDNGTLEFWKNGVSMGVAFTDLMVLGKVRPSATTGTASNSLDKVTFRFDKSEFSYSMPVGYDAYGTDVVNLTELPSIVENDFINHGMNSISDFSTLITKNTLIQRTFSTIESGKKFEHTIDLTDKEVKSITL